MDRPCIAHEQRQKSAPNPLELTQHKDPAAALCIAIRSTKTVASNYLTVQNLFEQKTMEKRKGQPDEGRKIRQIQLESSMDQRIALASH